MEGLLKYNRKGIDAASSIDQRIANERERDRVRNAQLLAQALRAEGFDQLQDVGNRKTMQGETRPIHGGIGVLCIG